MPIYAYECTKCGEQAEYIQKVSDAPMKKCEECGGKLSKLMTAAAFHLKGGGWYETDFKSGGKKNLAGDSGSKSESSTAAKSSTSSDAG